MKTFLLGLLILSGAAFAADKKITDLTSLPAASWATGDTIPIVDVSASETKKTTINDFDTRYQLVGNYLTGLSGDVSASGPGVGVATITALARSKLANGTANHVVINSGTGALSSEAQLAISRGGTGQATANAGFNALSPLTTLGDLLYGGASGVGTRVAGNTTTTKKYLSQTGDAVNSAAPTWAQPACADLSNAAASCSTDATNATNIGSGTLAVARGGTGIASGTSGGVLSYTASGTLASSGALTASQLVIGGGAGVAPSSLAAGSQYQVLRMGAANPAYGSINLDQSAAVTGTLPIGNGGTGQTTYTDGQLLIGNSSGNTLTKATLTQGANVTITNGNGSITIAASSSATPVYSYVSQSSTLNPAIIGSYYLLSGASFNITLPTAASIAGQTFIFQHNGTSLTQVYTFLTTSSQTIDGVASGSYALYTNSETLMLVSDGSNWHVLNHKTETDWASAGTIINFVTFTITSGSATIAATYVPAYVFTITAGNTATAAAVYSSGGNNCTLGQNILVGDTTAIFQCAVAPAASGSLVYVSGTHTGGNISFSSVVGNLNTTTHVVTKTVASGVTLITSAPVLPNASGKLIKTGGTGDAVITYSSYTGTAENITATTTRPVFYGSPTTNSYQWRRHGRFVVLLAKFFQGTAGPIGGTGDWILPLPTGMPNIDVTNHPTSTTGTAVAAQVETANFENVYPTFASGSCSYPSQYQGSMTEFAPYSASTFRIYGSATGATTVQAMGASLCPANQVTMGFHFQVEFAVSGFQP